MFEARLSDIGVVLGALEDLVPQTRPRTPIGIFGHSNGGAAAAVAIWRHPQIQAGVNLDGFIPGGVEGPDHRGPGPAIRADVGP